MRNETKDWITKANRDLSTAGFADRSVDGPLPVTTALHCQQAAEKYFKAFLQEHDATFLSSFQLTSLFESCITLDPSFEILRPTIKQLGEYSIASRYPKASESREFRNEALACGRQVQEFVLGKLA
jgi:HEPN domain-containing protein